MEGTLRSSRTKAPARTLILAMGLLAGCSGGHGTPGPYIAAAIVSFPPGAGPPGFDSGAAVAVADPGTGEPISTAAVTVNGFALRYDPAQLMYVGDVSVSPGDAVALGVSVGGRVYQASGAQFGSYPQVVTPAAGGAWAAYAEQGVTWSAGAPTADSSYALAVLDAANPNGDALWPPVDSPQLLPLGSGSFTLPADAVSAGDRLVVVGLAREVAIPGAYAGSALVIGGFSYTPVHVWDDRGQLWEAAAASGIPEWTDLRRVAWTGTQLVAVGYTTLLGNLTCLQYGNILTSPDGLAWTPRIGGCADVPSMVLQGVASSGAQLVVVGGPAILSSADGATWTGRSGAEGHILLDVAWTGAAFVAVGQAGFVLTSPDGATWTARTSGTSADLRSVAWTGERLVAVGGTTLLVSDDGTSWSAGSSGTTNGLLGVASSPGRTIAVGNGGTIVASGDGLSWTPVASGTEELTAAAWSGHHFAVVGAQGAIATSADGTTWTPRSSPFGYDLWGEAWTGTRWVAVGDVGTVLVSP